MLETGLEGSTFAGLIALFGVAQALLPQRQRGIRERILSLWTLYFTGHLIAAIVLLCVWTNSPSLAQRDIAFRLLLENAWIEALSITLCSCLRITVENEGLYNMFRCIAAITYVLHISGFLLLVIGQDNGKPMLFGASLLIPSSLLGFLIQIRSSPIRTTLRFHLIGIYFLSSVIVLAVLAAIRDDHKFLQANVILATVTSLVIACLPFSRPSETFKGLGLRHPRPYTLRWSSKSTRKRESGELAQQYDGSTFHLGEQQGYLERQGVFESKSTELTYSSATPPPSPLLPPAATHLPSSRLREGPSTILDKEISFDGAPMDYNCNCILVTTEVDTYHSNRWDAGQLGTSCWVPTAGSQC